MEKEKKINLVGFLEFQVRGGCKEKERKKEEQEKQKEQESENHPNVVTNHLALCLQRPVCVCWTVLLVLAFNDMCYSFC